jgi:hypothetical protein
MGAGRRRRSRSQLAHDGTDTGWHGMAPDDTGRHVDAGPLPGRSNLRIRCRKGRGGSNPPSRTASDVRIFAADVSRSRAWIAVLLTLAHEIGSPLATA